MDKKQIAGVLEEMGTLLELQGANPFRCRAFHNGARLLESITEDLTTLVAEKRLTIVKGIGPGLASVIADLVTSGKSREYEKLRKSLPEGLLEMVRIQGLGPKRVKILHEKLKIKTLADLKRSCEQHRLSKLEGFGPKSEENILKGIELLSKVSDKFLFPTAWDSASKIVATLSSLGKVKRCEVAGSLRRHKEVIGDIDIVVSAPDKERGAIFEAFGAHEEVDRVLARGDTKSSVLLKPGIQCDLRIVKDTEFPFALNYFTGSKEHNVEMRSLANAKGWSLNEYGFTRLGKGGKTIPVCKSEEDLYKALGLAFVPPELRENMGEIEAARSRSLPGLVEEQDLRGTFHCHTTYSDGSNTLDQMARAAQEKGWDYWGVADHSQVAAYAGGLHPDKVKEQHKAVDALNARMNKFRIFKGTECDILADGTLDYPDRVLASFDYVVVSIHSKFKMTEAEATKRIIAALKNRYTTILGHPTGRLLLSREGYPVNMPEVIQAASDYGKAIEINSHPLRLDIDWRFLRLAKEKKVRVCINPDAHNIDGLSDVRYGVGIARKGWLEPADIVNTWTTKQVETFFTSVRS